MPIGERVESVAAAGIVAFSVSTTGVLTYGVGETSTTNLQLTWVDRKGGFVGTLGPPAPYRGINLSPDGLKVAAHRHEGGLGDLGIGLIDDAEILVDHHDRRQSADRRLDREELMKLLS